MDDKRFDHLAKLVGKGASRRAILKGLFGVGGAAAAGAVAPDDANARARISRPTIPPPPPPTTTSTTTTAAPCPVGQQQCPNSTLCCPTGTCARSGNAAICCDGASGNGNVVCGLDCCDTDNQCCDGECCPDGTVCLAQVFGEGPFVEEETCCLLEQACDDQCCDGTCFSPTGASTGVARECCPEGGTICTSAVPGALCCAGDTPQCCVPDGVTRICIAEDACCTDLDCAHLNDPASCQFGVCSEQRVCETFDACPSLVCCGSSSCCAVGQECCPDTINGVPVFICIDPTTQCCTTDDCVESGFDRDCVTCNIDTHACEPANENTTCTEFECGICQSGQCAPDESLCFACEQCSAEFLRCVPDCRGSGCGCPQCQTCNQDTGVCEPLCGADQHCCGGACFDVACCTIDGCVATGFDRDCVTCDVATNTCIPAFENSTCTEFECGICQSGQCAPDEGLCFACEQCSAEFLRCVPDCRGSGCGCPTCQTCNQETGVCDQSCA
jgi:hypothetical protein